MTKKPLCKKHCRLRQPVRRDNKFNYPIRCGKYHETYGSLFDLSGANPGARRWIGRLATPPPPHSLGSFKFEIKKGDKTITEATLSHIVPISFCQVSHPPPFKNPGSVTACTFLHVLRKVNLCMMTLASPYPDNLIYIYTTDGKTSGKKV